MKQPNESGTPKRLEFLPEQFQNVVFVVADRPWLAMMRRRVVIGVVTLLAAVGAAAFVAFALPAINVGTAYKAKLVCSDIFVGGRSVDDAMADVAIDDYRALRLIRADVNMRERTTTARLFPFRSRQARYHDGFGCTLSSRVDESATAPHAATVVPVGAGDTVAALATDVRRALDAAIDDAFAEPDSTNLRRTRAVVVMQHGVVVGERYASGVTAETPLPGWSMAKSVLNALVGIAIKDHKLALDEPVRLRAWRTPGDPRGRTSVSDMLRMSTGLSFSEGQAGASSDLLRMLSEMPDMAAFAASKPLEVAVGTRWKYSTGTSMILSRVLREALGDDVYRRLPRTALFEPLGMTHAVLEADEGGTFVASSYMYATAREWGRFGQLYLQDGMWNGTRILPEGWVAYTRTPAPAAPPSTYGAHFWLATPAEYRGPSAAIPSDVFQAVGHEGQFVTIVPSHDVVIVRLGRTRHPSAWAHDRFVSAILAALQS